MSFVFLVVKLRVLPPTVKVAAKVEVAPPKKGDSDEQFLLARGEAEEMPQGAHDGGWAHAPHWPAVSMLRLLASDLFDASEQNRKPGWWLMLADPKLGRVIVPPLRITDVPISDGTSARDYRSYKIQFQAPPVQQTPLSLTWKIYLVSDTYISEDVTKDMTVNRFRLLIPSSCSLYT